MVELGYMVKIKDLPERDRPREKMIKYGPDKLTDEELLALVLGSGTRGVNVRTLAGRILRKNKEKLDSLTFEDLKNEKGLGKAKATQVIAVLELGKRLFAGKKNSLILSPQNVWERCEDFRSSKKEHFVVFFLDARSQEIKREIISVGTLTASLVHPREVFESAIKANAVSIILVHNHPSGDVNPSDDDIDISKKLIHAGRILSISIVNHIVVTKDSYASIDMIYDQNI